MPRPLEAVINLDAFRHNYRLAKQRHGTKVLAVVKANAYGHGAVECALSIQDEADGYAVASVEEALVLRQSGISAPILLLEGFFEAEELTTIAAYDLSIVIHHTWQVDVLSAAKLTQPIHVWLKIDTGMHRLGLNPEQAIEACDTLSGLPDVAVVVCMTHFMNADNPELDTTKEQANLFKQTIAACQSILKNKFALSMDNSAGILNWPDTHADWGRAGIMLYGADPLYQFAEHSEPDLKPVMTLKSKLIAVNDIDKGEAIGYGGIYTTRKVTRIGVVACGYADGYPRRAAKLVHGKIFRSASVWVEGKKARLIGRVSMDMLIVDLSSIHEAEVGSEVELWGEHISVNDVAEMADTISYELLCNVKRAKFSYINK